MKQKRPIRTTTILIIVLLCFLAGIGFARLFQRLDISWVVTAALCSLSVFLLSKRNKQILLGGLCVTLFLVGWARGAQVMTELDNYDAVNGKQVTITATALGDAVYSKRGQLSFTVGDIALQKPTAGTLIGEVDVEGMGVPIVYKGDKLQIAGKLFKKRGGQVAGISFANLTINTRTVSPIDTFRRNFAAGMQNSLPEPLASFGMGLLIGQRATLDDQLTQQLITVGLIHIVAVSGYNLTIIIDIIRRIFRRRSRFQVLCLSLALIGAFLLCTGQSPSIVRAALVSSISLAAWFFGRTFRPVLLLVFVAALTAGVNPLYLWSNVGWYLSFTAFYGVLVVGPLLKQRVFKSANQDNIIPTLLSETLGAQLCTLPIILFVFGRLSVVGVLANMLVVPLVPAGMLFSLVAGLSGMAHIVISKLLAFPAQLVLEYMLSVANLLSRVPHANILVSVTMIQMLCLYGCILLLALVMSRKTPAESVIITDIKEQ